MTHVIKRYPNRKLYSAEKSHYVTLSEIFDMMANGQEVKVIDNASGDDITLKTLKAGLYQLDISMDQVKGMIRNVGKTNATY
jgi:polyhydroxyalkanoate synthesis repressor PhaR